MVGLRRRGGGGGVLLGRRILEVAKQLGDSGQRSKPAGLINEFVVNNFYDCFY